MPISRPMPKAGGEGLDRFDQFGDDEAHGLLGFCRSSVKLSHATPTHRSRCRQRFPPAPRIWAVSRPARSPADFHTLAAGPPVRTSSAWVVLALTTPAAVVTTGRTGAKSKPALWRATRADSATNGFAGCRCGSWLTTTGSLVHDAAWPCISAAMLDALSTWPTTRSAAFCRRSPIHRNAPIPNSAWRRYRAARRPRQAQTPQMFRYGLVRRRLENAAPTDEAGAIEALGLLNQLVRGDATNLKVTYPGRSGRLAAMILRGTQMNFRVGQATTSIGWSKAAADPRRRRFTRHRPARPFRCRCAVARDYRCAVSAPWRSGDIGRHFGYRPTLGRRRQPGAAARCRRLLAERVGDRSTGCHAHRPGQAGTTPRGRQRGG